MKKTPFDIMVLNSENVSSLWTMVYEPIFGRETIDILYNNMENPIRI